MIAAVLIKSARDSNFSSPQIGLAGSTYIAAGPLVARVGDEDEVRDAPVFGLRWLPDATD